MATETCSFLENNPKSKKINFQSTDAEWVQNLETSKYELILDKDTSDTVLHVFKTNEIVQEPVQEPEEPLPGEGEEGVVEEEPTTEEPGVTEEPGTDEGSDTGTTEEPVEEPTITYEYVLYDQNVDVTITSEGLIKITATEAFTGYVEVLTTRS